MVVNLVDSTKVVNLVDSTKVVNLVDSTKVVNLHLLTLEKYSLEEVKNVHNRTWTYEITVLTHI